MRISTIYLIAILLLCTQHLKAQTDSLQLSEETIGADTVDYLTPIEYAFMMHEETPWMFKLGLPLPSTASAQGNSVTSGKLLGLSYERKIGLDWSIDMSARYLGSSFSVSDGNVVESESAFDFKISPRWYYNMKKKMRENRTANNLSGNYFALGLTHQRTTNAEQLTTYTVEWGIQRRYLKNGFVDFRFLAGYSAPNKFGRVGSFIVGTNINIGLAFAKDNQRLNDARLCDIFRCYETEKRLFKFNLLNAFNAAFISGVQQIGTSLEFGYEEKIGDTPFSFASHVTGSYNRLENRDLFTAQLFHLQLKIGPRYYYNLKRQIAKGKSGNGLSGNYFSIEYGVNFVSSRVTVDSGTSISDFAQTQVGFLMGFQRTISDKLYYDINFGMGVKEGGNNVDGYEWHIPINIGIGFRL